MAFEEPGEKTEKNQPVILEYRRKTFWNGETYIRLVGSRDDVEELWNKSTEK